MFVFSIVLLCALWLNPGVALANSSSSDPAPAKANFTIVADEPEVMITVWHGAGANYSRSVRLTAQSADPSQKTEVAFMFFSYDLENQQGGRVVDRQNITLEPKDPKNNYKILLNTPTNFQVKIIGIEVPGTYKGQIEFWPKGAERDKSLKLPLTIKATPPQPLVPVTGSTQVTLHLTKGRLSESLLPNETIAKRMLTFENPYHIDATLAEKEAILNEEITGNRLDPSQVKVENIPNQVQPNASIINIPLAWEPDKIPPDRYSGTIFLKVNGAREALKLPITLTMRYGPGLGIFLLVLGIVLGQFVHWMNTKGLARAKLEEDLSNLKDQILKADSDDQTILIPMLQKVRQAIADNDQTTAAEELKKIEGRLDLLDKMHKIEDYAGALAQEPGFQELLKDIRKEIDLGNEDKAKQLLEQLDDYSPPQQMKRFVASILPPAAGPPSPPKLREFGKWLRWWQEKHPGFFIKVLVWAFYLIMLLVFVYVGLTTIYLKNPTFGMTPLTDYAALVLWGLGSDVASRNLQGVLGRLG